MALFNSRKFNRFSSGSFSTIEFKLNGLSDGVKEYSIFNVWLVGGNYIILGFVVDIVVDTALHYCQH